MTEKQYPPTREQIAEALYRQQGSPIRGMLWMQLPAWAKSVYLHMADAVLALFPKPTPSAEPSLREQVQALRDEMFAELDSPDHLVPLDSLIERMDAMLAEQAPSAEPPSIADMALGTTCHEEVSGTVPSWAGEDQVSPCLCVLDPGHDGRHQCSHQVDPSTIRDVTPPKES